ncbi:MULTISPECIES: DUF427 domain-containing protein [Flammeovirga]|uniref:DUF427 domain-containing protein n=1 Tax=Flammeovirga agarivorans TaxID=2726742 RepID=A0A7X8XVW3_9BACT|nr:MULTISPECIES: DUF427 domain-containing protein [Flammeovirga]NLR91728.1 DUF427 domain-containing protein [Flammeovirga agarivorans]
MKKAIWNGTVLAESNDTIEVEGNAYFPPSSIKKEYFTETSTNTTCPWKGTASYYTIEIDGQKNVDAAWFYKQPSAKASQIKDYVAFWKGVEVV